MASYKADITDGQLSSYIKWDTYALLPIFDSDNPNGPYTRYETNIENGNKYLQLSTLKEHNIISQTWDCSSMLVNPYANLTKVVEIDSNPKSFSWVDEDVVRAARASYSETITTGSGNRVGGIVDSYTRVDTTINNEIINGSRNVPRNTIRVFTRQGAFNPYESVWITLANLDYKFSGRANADGLLDTSLVLGGDSKLKSGTHKVIIQSKKQDEQEVIPGTTTKATASNSTGGTLINFIPLRKVTTNSEVTVYVRQLYNSDPLSQTFLTPADDMFLSSLEIIFDSIDLTKFDPSQAQNGLIDRNNLPTLDRNTTFSIDEDVSITVLETYVGQPDLTKVLITKNIPKGTKVNNKTFYKVIFNDKVFLEGNKEYAFIVETVSQNLKCRIASLGCKDLNTNNFISSQPYTDGVLLSSSNKSTWTAHQESDMTFKINKTEFKTSRTLQYKFVGLNDDNVLEFSNVTNFMLMCSEIFKNQFGSVTYTLKVGDDEFDIKPYEKTYFEKPLNGIPVLTIKLDTTNKFSTPTLLKDIQIGIGSTLVNHPNPTKSIYITENIQLEGNKYLHVYFDLLSGNVNSIKVYYSLKEANITEFGDWTLIPKTETKYNKNEVFYKTNNKLTLNNYVRVMLVIEKSISDSSNVIIENLRVLARI